MRTMKTNLASILAAMALGLAPASALAQTAPASTMPVSSPAPAETATAAPAPAAPSAAPSTPAPAATRAAGGTRSGADPGAKHLDQVKKLPNGSLSMTDLRYGLTHPLQEANQVRKMKTVSFDKLRVYRLSSGLKSMLKIGDADSDIPVLAVLGPGLLVAQTTGLPNTNGSNSPIAYLQYALANINVSNALNNVSVLNGANVNVGVSLADVLNGNKISIGQVAGIFVNGLGIITTITK
ncbi:MAG: hypothetical protein JWO66_2478 [Candidatus Eremiobacteraeota bacterium]|jgi:hypothetical protein|nr:hypothetical protein [Candidatus Eremiobacteraeota bacterium]